MPSQYDYLVDNDLREGLRRCHPPAEIRLAQRYNRGRRPEARLIVPAAGSAYGRYDDRLLALLWATVRNATALQTLTRMHGEAALDPPDYGPMTEAILAYLWTWGRDAEALETLWTRRGLLPFETVDGQTPDAVLGFLWWRQRRPDARDELFRRYHLGGASDAAQDRALTLLLLIDRWDYERYATLASLLNVSSARHRIDAGRHLARAPLVDQNEAEKASAPSSPYPEALAEARDFLDREVPLELRCLHKIKENSEEQPLDLTAEELDYLARKNLIYTGSEEVGGPSLARERTRILEWMARHPEPAEEQIRAFFPWFRQSGLARQTRLWRLRWRADENDRLLTTLVSAADKTTLDLACLVQENMDELARRIDEAGRKEGTDDRGTVLLFAQLMDAAHRLRIVLEARRLCNGHLARLGEWQANLQAFLEAFPILIKLAACRRLAYLLLHAGFPSHEVPVLNRLSDWLDGGQWLATFGRDDREQSELFRHRLLALRGQFQDDARAALDLLLLWLESAREPGEPERHLLDADRAWWLSHDPPHAWPDDLPALANELAVALTQGDWALVASSAGTMFRRLHSYPGAAGWPGRELQDCLHRLSKCR